MSANRAASIRARLKQRAAESKQDFNLTLTRYGLERLLYRLSVSDHAGKFLLKGALLFQLWCPTLLPDPTLDAAELVRAIAATFARRQTAVPEVWPIGFSEAFAQDAAKQLQWRAFLNRNRLEALDLSAVLLFVRTRLQAVDFPHR